MKVKMFLSIGTPVEAISIITLSLGCTANVFKIERVVYANTRLTTLLVNDTCIELQPILSPMLDIPDQLSPQIIQEVLKASGVDFSKFEHYKQSKANLRQHLRLLNCTNLNKFFFSFPPICITFPDGLQPATSGHANQELNVY